MGKKSPPKIEIEDRPEGTRDEDILWLRRDLNWKHRDIAQALQVSTFTVHTVLKRHGLAGRAA
jgi:hypothetical protein